MNSTTDPTTYCESLLEQLPNPPTSHRPAPLWVWNDKMQPEQITHALQDFKEHGFGGAFVHPRPGLITEYLSEEWFGLWGHALETAKALGLKLYIYDENSYPSGFAGGHVSSQLPDCLATGMSYSIFAMNDQNIHERLDAYLDNNTLIVAFACQPDDIHPVLFDDLTLLPRRQWHLHAEHVFVVKLIEPVRTGWLAGFGFVDLLRPEVTQAFVDSTHERYHSRFGADFGDAIPALFTDEPYIAAGAVYSSIRNIVPFSYWFANVFEQRHGYPLLRNLPCVFRNVRGGAWDRAPQKVRYDYYRTIRDLWVENNIAPIGKWCEEHRIQWTGHYLEHQWPHCAFNTSPSMQSNYEYHGWPAIDMLLSGYLRDTETHALALTIREIRSAANQFAKERTLCELYGAGGWDSDFEDYKRMADWVMVNGINFINQHLSYSSYAGARKRDHPQSFDSRQSWWDSYTHMNNYVGRVRLLLSQGRMEQRILVLNPSTTGYLIPPEEERGDLFSISGTDAMQNPDMSGFLTLSQTLANAQWDFDYGDEFTLARHARIDGTRLIVGAQAYDVLLVSCDMRNMLAATVQLLRDFMERGGRVYGTGAQSLCSDSSLAFHVDGVEDADTYRDLSEAWVPVELADIDTILHEVLEPHITSDVAFPTGFAHMRRVLEDGSRVWFLVNHSFTTFDGVLSMVGSSVSAVDLWSGEQHSVRYSAHDGKVHVAVRLVRNQSLMLLVQDLALVESHDSFYPASEESCVESDASSVVSLPLVLQSICRDSLNVMPLLYGDLKIGNREYLDIKISAAADLVYSSRGFKRNPWDNQVQFRQNILDKNVLYGEDSGFCVLYPFVIAEGAQLRDLRVVAEQKDLCRICVNGSDVPWTEGDVFLDAGFGSANITDFVREGDITWSW